MSHPKSKTNLENAVASDKTTVERETQRKEPKLSTPATTANNNKATPVTPEVTEDSDAVPKANSKSDDDDKTEAADQPSVKLRKVPANLPRGGRIIYPDDGTPQGILSTKPLFPGL